MATDLTPTYNLKAVVQETGLKPDTLRAWERRYGIPEPDRTGGGHRLYSQHDINTLKWLLDVYKRQAPASTTPHCRRASKWRSFRWPGK